MRFWKFSCPSKWPGQGMEEIPCTDKPIDLLHLSVPNFLDTVVWQGLVWLRCDRAADRPAAVPLSCEREHMCYKIEYCSDSLPPQANGCLPALEMPNFVLLKEQKPRSYSWHSLKSFPCLSTKLEVCFLLQFRSRLTFISAALLSHSNSRCINCFLVDW